MIHLRAPAVLGAVVGGCLLTAACAAPQDGDAAIAYRKESVKAVAGYYSLVGLPSGWHLREISSHNDNVFVVVDIEPSVITRASRLSGKDFLAFFASICPPPNDGAWQAIDDRKDIVVEVKSGSGSAFQAACRQHGSRFGGA